MSLYANPILYLNLGGEMLYVVQQRLRAQKIKICKAKKVIEDVTAALIDPQMISMIFQKSPTQELSWMRTTLEKIILCSIMKLDKDSMNKLFDLMMMMVKYQLVAATGPREVILITLNHLDAINENITKTSTQEFVALTYKTIMNYYNELTYDEIWQARKNCLDKLANINVRVSVLLRLGLQNEDTSFNIRINNYNEGYDKKQSILGSIKFSETSSEDYQVGSFGFNDDRVTILGKNMYTHNGNPPRPRSPLVQKEIFHRDEGSRVEIALLAKQLGTDNQTLPTSMSFNFDILVNEFDDSNYSNNNNKDDENITEQNNQEKLSNEDYRNKLENIYADFFDDQIVNKKLNLLQLLDDAE